ncbi:hypothetical protein [Pollutibacter soli]
MKNTNRAALEMANFAITKNFTRYPILASIGYLGDLFWKTSRK